MDTHHATKTYKNRPACAGSGMDNPTKGAWGNVNCSVCGRTGFSPTAKGLVGTHLHSDDLASTTTYATATQPKVREITPHTFTLAQHAAIRAFSFDPSTETYAALQTTGAKDYTRYAREMGWT